MIVLWTAAVYLHKCGAPAWACLMAALPATFMSAVSITYFFQVPECLNLPVSIAYPVGAIGTGLLLGIFIRRTWIKNKDDPVSTRVRISSENEKGRFSLFNTAESAFFHFSLHGLVLFRRTIFKRRFSREPYKIQSSVSP